MVGSTEETLRCLTDGIGELIDPKTGVVICHAEQFFDVAKVIAACELGTRPPPMLPSKAAAELTHKSFFSAADVPTVARLYETFFDAVAPSPTELLLGKMEWGAAEVAALASALPRFERLAKLHLTGNKMGDAGAIAIAEALRKHSSITEVELDRCAIKDAGAAAIATALHQNASSKVRHLELEGNEIGDAGAKALAILCAEPGSLRVLHLGPQAGEGRVKLTEEGRAALKQAVARLDLIWGVSDLGVKHLGERRFYLELDVWP